jgi:hypothetical protein
MKKAFVLLELVNHMVLVAKEAKARGHHVIALNHDPLRRSGPFAVPDGLIDELVPVESWGDREKLAILIRQLHERYEVVGTYAAFEGSLVAESMLRELAGLPHNSPRNVRKTLDKGTVRATLRAEGLSALGSATLEEARHWSAWPFPAGAVLKPANGTGSALCFRVFGIEELRAAADKAASLTVVNPLMREYIHQHGGFVVEQEASGELLSVESLVSRGQVHHLGLMGRYVLTADPVVEQGILFPYHHPREAEIVARAEAFHHCMGIVHGPTHIEVMVPDEGPVELIDFNVRSAGVAAVVCFSEAFGTPHEVALTDLACGAEPDLSFLGRTTRYATDMLLLPPPGAAVMEDIRFPDDAICCRPTKEPGEKLSGRSDQLDVVGMFVISADTPAEIHAKSLEARRRTVFNGQPLGDHPRLQLSHPRHLGMSPAPTALP